MTVSSSTNRNGPYTGNGSTTVFARTFLVTDADHLKVYQTVSGVTTEVTSGITKDGIGTASGNVTFGVAPATGTQITLVRETPLTQDTDYSAQGVVSTTQVETDLDLAAMRVQDQQESLGRTVKVPVSSALTDLELPAPVANTAIGWNAAGDGMANVSGLPTATLTASTDNAVMRYDAATGGLQDSGATLDDSGNLSLPVALAVAQGGTGATTASGARSALGLVIGTAVQAYHAILSSLSGLSLVAGDIIYATGASAFARLAKGTAGQVLTMNSGATAPEWATVPGVKAWAVFNGTGTPALVAAYNVSSITDNGTGDYTLNFSTSLASSNYAVVASVSQNGTSSTFAHPGTRAAGSIQVLTKANTSGENATPQPWDASAVYVVVFA